MMRTAFTALKRTLLAVVCGLSGTAVAHADSILLGTDYLAVPRGGGRAASFLDLGPEFGGVRSLVWRSPMGMAIARRENAVEPFPDSLPIELLDFDFLVLGKGNLSVGLTQGVQSTANLHLPMSSPNFADFFMTASPVWRPTTVAGLLQAKSLIPEPSTLSLLGLATVALVSRRRRPA